MSNLQDVIALVIVLVCVVYTMRTLLPGSVLARIGGKTAPDNAGNCGGCNSCDAGKKSTDDGCH